tara:strand:+ start:1129 stop:1329 length:201 start_codon:yes stop_codon:yes gene_type:complete
MNSKSIITSKQTNPSKKDIISKPNKDRIIELKNEIQLLEKSESDSQCQDCLILGSCPFHQDESNSA